MKKLVIAAVAMALLPASAQAMSVAEFLAKANALKAKGFLAIGSPEIKLPKGARKTSWRERD